MPNGSGFDERQKISINRVRVRGGHAVWEFLVSFQGAILQQFCAERRRVRIGHDLIMVAVHHQVGTEIFYPLLAERSQTTLRKSSGSSRITRARLGWTGGRQNFSACSPDRRRTARPIAGRSSERNAPLESALRRHPHRRDSCTALAIVEEDSNAMLIWSAMAPVSNVDRRVGGTWGNILERSRRFCECSSIHRPAR
jgi:hypothetical protein